MKRIGVVLLVACVVQVPLMGQWLKQPTAGLPRTPDGKPDLAAPVPRGEAGRPVLVRPLASRAVAGRRHHPRLHRWAVPFQPWAETLFKKRVADFARDDPSAKCIMGGVPRADFVPYPFKILEVPGMVVILYEAIQGYRQIFTDGRQLPKDPNPAWMGYSVGRWEGDVFVVESSGFNDDVWLDNMGRPATGALRVTERFVRRTVGQMDIEITIDDPKAYTRPWNVTQRLALQPDTELLEYICNENNRYFEILPKVAK